MNRIQNVEQLDLSDLNRSFPINRETRLNLSTPLYDSAHLQISQRQIGRGQQGGNFFRDIGRTSKRLFKAVKKEAKKDFRAVKKEVKKDVLPKLKKAEKDIVQVSKELSKDPLGTIKRRHLVSGAIRETAGFFTKPTLLKRGIKFVADKTSDEIQKLGFGKSQLGGSGFVLKSNRGDFSSTLAGNSRDFTNRKVRADKFFRVKKPLLPSTPVL